MTLLLIFALIHLTTAADVYAVRHGYQDAACTEAGGYDELYYWGECWPTLAFGKGTVKWKGADDNGITECLYDSPPLGDTSTDGCTGTEECTTVPYDTCIAVPVNGGQLYYKWRKLDSVANGYTRMAYNGGTFAGEPRSCAGISIKPVNGRMPATLPAPATLWKLNPPREYFVTSDTSGNAVPNITTCVDPTPCPSSITYCPSAVWGTRPTGTGTIVTCTRSTCNPSIPCNGGSSPFETYNLDNGATCQTGNHAGTVPRPLHSSGYSSRFSGVLPNPDTRGVSSTSSGSAVKPWMMVTWVVLLFIVPKR